MKTQILDHNQIQKILKRMAYQIYENNFSKKELIFAAINGQGKEVAELIGQELTAISKVNIKIVEIAISKEKPEFNSAKVDLTGIKLAGKTIILFDDVLNTGRTLIYGMQPFLTHALESLQIAVLVERKHKSFPVSADYIGLSLQTTLQEHVVVLMKEKFTVYLT